MLAPNAADSLHRRFSAEGALLACISDADVSATLCSFAVPNEGLLAAIKTAAETIGVTQSVGRAFRIEIQAPDAARVISDEALRAVAVELHGALRSSVYVTRRSVPAGRFSAVRAMGWGAQGLVLGDAAPALPFGGSESSGVAIEAGGPTVIAKTRITGILSLPQMKAIAAACGGLESGLVEVGVYPVATGRDGAATFVLELSDVKRAPLHRAFAVLDIEARRFGAQLGLGSLLSNAPLELFLDTLATHMGLGVAAGQVIETHLQGAAAPSPR
jgi:hypothetical protein